MPDEKHKRLEDEAARAVDKLFSDTSVSEARTRESLEDLMDFIRNKLETLPD